MDAPQSQKSVLGGLIAFGILAIVLGMFQIQRAIRPTRATAPSSTPTIPRTREELEAAQRAAVAGVDTDRDGLDDLTELEATRTSPFLADSDSDGKTDKEEVDAGEDPNCPKGKMCVAGPPAEAAPRPAPPPLDFPGAPSTAMGASAGVTSEGTPIPLTPTEIRAALERQGVSSSVIRQLSDAQLESAYRSMIQSLTKLPDGRPSPLAGAMTKAFEDALRDGRGSASGAISALPSDPATIRTLLIRSGFPREQLTQLDDRTLLSVWTKIVADMQPQSSTP